MPRRAQNVIQLHPRRRSSEDLPVSLERLGVAVQELDDLQRCIEQTVRELSWPTLEWRVVCTPLMLRLSRARRLLADLSEIRAGRWPDTDWAVRFRAACDEAERRLLDVSMSSFPYGATSSVDAAANFRTDSTRLAEAVDEVCDLIASRYPEAVDDI